MLRSVANIASAPSVPVSAGVSTSGRGGCLLQQSADTAALQRVNTLTFSRPDTQHRHRGHTFTRNCRRCHGGGKGNTYNQEFAELLLYFADKKYQSFQKCEFWSSRARRSRRHSHINRRGSGEQPWRSSWPPPSTQHQPPAVQHCIEEYPFKNYLFTSVSNWYVHCPH